MSMREYAVDDYGLIFDEKTMKHIAFMLFNELTEEEWESDKQDIMCDVEENIALDSVCPFTGELMPLCTDGSVDYGSSDTIYIDDDVVYYASASKSPKLFGAAYKNIDEVIAEFKDGLEKYLPTDFDYKSHIMKISGTVWG